MNKKIFIIIGILILSILLIILLVQLIGKNSENNKINNEEQTSISNRVIMHITDSEIEATEDMMESDDLDF